MTIDKQQKSNGGGGYEKMACLRDVGQRLLLLSYFFFKACYTSTKRVVETIILLLSFCPFASIGVMCSDTLAHIENLLARQDVRLRIGGYERSPSAGCALGIYIKFTLMFIFF